MKARDNVNEDILLVHVRCNGNLLRSKPFGTDAVLIGRDPGCDLRIENDSVSRFHSRISRQDAGFSIEDLGSRNGTLVNGERIAKGPLKNGDIVRTGKMELTVEICPPADTSKGDDMDLLRGLAQDTIPVTPKHGPSS